MNTILQKHSFYEEQLEKAVQKRAAESPEFHCFHVVRKEAEQASFALYHLKTHPEAAFLLEKEYQLWQKKYAAYCKERDQLLIR